MRQRGLELGQQGWSMNGQRVSVEKSMMLLTRGIGRGIIKKEGKISLKACFFPDFETLHYGGGKARDLLHHPGADRTLRFQIPPLMRAKAELTF